MLATNFFTSSRKHMMSYFMLILVVFSTTMRFANAEEKTEGVETNFITLLENTEIDNYSSDKQLSDRNKEQQEKEPLTIKTAASSEALLQGFVSTELFYNIILTPSIECIFPSFSTQKINSVSFYFSSSGFFKTLFRCFISPNAP